MKVFLIAGQSNAVGTSPTDGLEGYVFPDVLLWQAGEFTEENEKLQNVWLRGVRPGMGYTPRHSGIELGICAGLKKGMPRAFVRYAYGTTDLVRDWRSESLWRALPGKRGDAALIDGQGDGGKDHADAERGGEDDRRNGVDHRLGQKRIGPCLKRFPLRN